jgi:RNA polymerase sigma factor (sigma-70 family)
MALRLGSRAVRTRARAAEPAPAPVRPDLRELAQSHLPLVLSEVEKVFIAPGIGLERDDLVSAGVVGLIRAARKYDPARGVAFGVFARTYVRGAILDEIRSVIHRGVPIETMVLPGRDEAFDPDSVADLSADPPDVILASRVRRLMETLLDANERLLLTLYYHEDLTIREIARVLQQSVSSVGRGLTRSINKLKQGLREEESGNE